MSADELAPEPEQRIEPAEAPGSMEETAVEIEGLDSTTP